MGSCELENVDFVEPDAEFAEDDLFGLDDISETNLNKELGLADTILTTSSFLERDNFEKELGCSADDPFAEDFSNISQHEIVNVIADGDWVGRPIVVIYAYRLPSNKTFDHAKFLRFLQFTLDKLVELDYTIVYFHYGLRSNNKPSLKWLLQAYSILDRKYKKNLKALYLVHPTRFIRIVWSIFKPFISIKFEQKIHYVNYLHELDSILRVEQLSLPQPIKEHDVALLVSSRITPKSQLTKRSCATPRPTQQFNVPLKFILSHNPDCDVPPVVTDLTAFLRDNSLNVVGLFRRSAEVNSIRKLQERIDRGEQIDFLNEEPYKDNLQVASIAASVLLKTFLRSLGEPVITNALYPRLTALSELPKDSKLGAIIEIVDALPLENWMLLKTVCQFLTEVAAHSKENLMNANNLSVVFGPNLTWPTDREVPIAQLNNLNHFCYRLIVDYDKVFKGK
ncbi:RhoGAP domain containing protein [Brugia malayi]|uniref:BMA-RGA-1 n=2 Tax=Brugia TaxID=6278 RepID=A0A0H5S4P2_BRUMA|nr:RhoGAP domain containing protein [Brugia malayi]CRZ23579.1 BMA-RGA-1 [Brugia malayi]VIO94028.1 RhoGAP domain containing protein [Brugia malayi]